MPGHSRSWDPTWGRRESTRSRIRLSQHEGIEGPVPRGTLAILFAFDTERAAILLLGGNKAGDKRWYDKNIPIADQRDKRHLQSLKQKKEK